MHAGLMDFPFGGADTIGQKLVRVEVTVNMKPPGRISLKFSHFKIKLTGKLGEDHS